MRRTVFTDFRRRTRSRELSRSLVRIHRCSSFPRKRESRRDPAKPGQQALKCGPTPTVADRFRVTIGHGAAKMTFLRTPFVAVTAGLLAASCSGTVAIVTGSGGDGSVVGSGGVGTSASSSSTLMGTGGGAGSVSASAVGATDSSTSASAATTTTGSGGSCGAPSVICGADCVDLSNDANNCGMCGVECVNTHGSTSCTKGKCAPICDPGWGDCNGTVTDGCEADTQTTVASCGGCGIGCTNPHGSTACVSGSCIPSCDADFGNCDGIVNNGCETDLQTSAGNCGACGADCAAGEFCVAKTCKPCLVAVSAAGSTCVLRGDGTLWCWGDNFYGQLADGSTKDNPTPTKVGALGTTVVDVVVGREHICVRKTDGALWCWGFNDNGQLGDGTQISKTSPQQVVALGTSVVEVSPSYFHTCARKSDGSLWCWGLNKYGEIGDGTQINRLSPVQVGALGTSVAEVAAGGYHTCARKTDGTLWCWGRNATGQLGNGTTLDSLSPVQVASLGSTVVEVAAGNAFTCARKADGTMWCWGSNFYGQIGNGTNVDTPSPIQVAALGGGVVQIALGVTDDTACARKADGTAWCWGSNFVGQMGDGTFVDKQLPVQVSALGTEVADVSANLQDACARKAD